ncbi:MAG: MoxR family ATPase [Acidobacteriota bacterium]
MKPVFEPTGTTVQETLPEGIVAIGDRSEGSVYVYDDQIVLAVNVALVTQRPLLVAGPPGSGKSSLALNIARVLGWRYEEEVLTPRTEARDLLWRFDAVRRLRDAQIGKLEGDEAYIDKGALWRAFESGDGQGRCVVLLDEIDKADPDVPNSLLEALGALRFTVAETGDPVTVDKASAPFIVLTTNEERELSRPFLRRCVVLRIRRPDAERLHEIAVAHGFDGDDDLTKQAIERLDVLALEADAAGQPAPSAAELIDVLRAARELEIDTNDSSWNAMLEVAMVKPPDGSP